MVSVSGFLQHYSHRLYPSVLSAFITPIKKDQTQIGKLCFKNFYLFSRETAARLDTSDSTLFIAIQSRKSLKDGLQSLKKMGDCTG